MAPAASQGSILVVEDDGAVRNLLVTALRSHGYRVEVAATGRSAVAAAATAQPDVIILDLGLPDMDGIEVVRTVRSWTQTPVIVVSARLEDADKIEALDAGADDYLTKPFSVGELLARVRVTLRRLAYLRGDEGGKGSPVFVNGDLRIDYAAGVATLKGEELHLTPIEYRLLCLLSKNVDKVLTHSYILREVWGEGHAGELGSLRVFMRTLRKKIEADPAHPRYIQTHVGVGYRMLRVE